jgi:nucleotide-binding universal stress UspA family protein
MHKTFSSILVPVDFSAHSTEALFYAASIAACFLSSLLVVHVIVRDTEVRQTPVPREHGESPVLNPSGLIAPDLACEVLLTEELDLHQKAQAALHNFLPFGLTQRPLTLRVTVGQPDEHILDTVQREGIDLIVMGTHGRTGLSHIALGSVAERVVRLAPCPVLTVKAARLPA